MTTTPTTTITTGQEMARAARARSVAIHGETRPSGPVAELMLERGFSPDQVTKVLDGIARNFREEMVGTLVGGDTYRSFMRTSRAAVRAARKAGRR